MPRARRVHVVGGLYHVTERGNRRDSLFGSPSDRDVLTSIVRATITQHGAKVLAYCWMSNHLHILMAISHVPLGKVMHQIATRYSRFRHRQLFQTGHLFERRYCAN